MTNNTLRNLALAATTLAAIAAPALAQKLDQTEMDWMSTCVEKETGIAPRTLYRKLALGDLSDKIAIDHCAHKLVEMEYTPQNTPEEKAAFDWWSAEWHKCVVKAANTKGGLSADLLERCHVDSVFNPDSDNPNLNFLWEIFRIATDNGRMDTGWAEDHCKLILSGARCEWNGYWKEYGR